jgi:hypothetical protein
MLKYVFTDKFNFLLIDTNEDYKNMYHKNLNKRLIFLAYGGRRNS